MSKRPLTLSDKGQNVVAKQAKKHWSLGLLESMKDPDSIYKQSERVVIIRDKYPKAKVHFLLLPHANINNIYKLGKEHIPLIEEFGDLFEMLRTEHKDYCLRAGFHMMPSMQRLHMHVISNDMISPCLKTKLHWNSFNTSFFKPYKDLLEELKENGYINKISNDLHKTLMVTPLKCNQCNYVPKNMPQLKEHLQNHN